MIKHLHIILIVLGSVFLTSCTDELRKKEEALQQREARLLEKEKAFALKESEYNSLLQMRDSIMLKRDTIVEDSIPAFALRKWTAKMVCTESACNEHVIGDQKIETWELFSEGNRINAKIFDKEKLIRVFTGFYDGKEIKLEFNNDGIVRTIILNDLTPTRMKGIREVYGANGCKAIYNTSLEPLN